MEAVVKTKVVHCKKEKYDVYIGRGSEWGNPFPAGMYGRIGCIKKYAQWIERQPHLMNKIKTLKGKTLGCWCKPLACHGDILIEMADRK